MPEILLAAEELQIPPDHVAANLAVPIAIVIFGGSVYLLLWSILGAKKGALVYTTALFGFSAILGIFWWFGAPGTVVAGGLRNFPGQPTDEYQAKWFPMEPGSPRASFFPVTNQGLEAFQSVREYVGVPPDVPAEGNQRLAALQGDTSQALDVMLEHFLPSEDGTIKIGQTRRQAAEEAAGEPRPGEERADPFFTARVATEDGEEQIGLVDSAGHRVLAAKLQMVATFQQKDAPSETREVVVEERTWYAFKDPGALWFPSAVWTGVSFVLFAASLFGLDLVEQREKRARAEAEEPADAPVTVGQ